MAKKDLSYAERCRRAYIDLNTMITSASDVGVKPALLVHKITLRFGLGQNWVGKQVDNLHEAGLIEFVKGGCVRWVGGVD